MPILNLGVKQQVANIVLISFFHSAEPILSLTITTKMADVQELDAKWLGHVLQAYHDNKPTWTLSQYQVHYPSHRLAQQLLTQVMKDPELRNIRDPEAYMRRKLQNAPDWLKPNHRRTEGLGIQQLYIQWLFVRDTVLPRKLYLIAEAVAIENGHARQATAAELLATGAHGGGFDSSSGQRDPRDIGQTLDALFDITTGVKGDFKAKTAAGANRPTLAERMAAMKVGGSNASRASAMTKVLQKPDAHNPLAAKHKFEKKSATGILFGDDAYWDFKEPGMPKTSTLFFTLCANRLTERGRSNPLQALAKAYLDAVYGEGEEDVSDKNTERQRAINDDEFVAVTRRFVKSLIKYYTSEMGSYLSREARVDLELALRNIDSFHPRDVFRVGYGVDRDDKIKTLEFPRPSGTKKVTVAEWTTNVSLDEVKDFDPRAATIEWIETRLGSDIRDEAKWQYGVFNVQYYATVFGSFSNIYYFDVNSIRDGDLALFLYGNSPPWKGVADEEEDVDMKAGDTVAGGGRSTAAADDSNDVQMGTSGRGDFKAKTAFERMRARMKASIKANKS